MTKEHFKKLIELHESIEKQIRKQYKCNLADKPIDWDYPIE